MALFVNRPQSSDPVNYITVGLNKTLLLVGLGNPGEEYTSTRHNTGFMCLDDFADRSGFDPWINKKDLQCLLASRQIGDTRVILIKPTTFMNLSGEAVLAVVHFYKLGNQQVTVVHDELDVDFGQIRTRLGGSSAGHNGIKSISKLIGEDYGRVRIGIGPKNPPQIDSADFVLQDFSPAERDKLPALLRETTALLSEYAYGSPVVADTRSFLA
jgi:PTH1 family peptidyl-tRNA hydrolase